MAQYYRFTAADALHYARQRAGLTNAQSLTDAQEIGDGNLNLVFRICDRQGVSSVVIKQALPYVRCVGESWPLTLDRARLEAETLKIHSQHCSEHTVKILHYDPQLAVIVMEDLSGLYIWRRELVQGRCNPQAAAQLGHYLARTLYYTSDFWLHPHEKKAQVARFINPEMCGITEDLFFNHPYQNNARNRYPTGLEETVSALRDDNQLRTAVAALKHRFFSQAEALLHGDIHSGSIFVGHGQLKVIDAEFGFYGPIGFDIGTAIGNLLLNYCGLAGLLPPREAADARESRLRDVKTVWQQFESQFLTLAAEKTNDDALAWPGYASQFLQKVLADAIGYCGTELIRRTIGMAHVADLEDIHDDETRSACMVQAVNLGKMLILAAQHIVHVDDFIARIRQHG